MSLSSPRAQACTIDRATAYAPSVLLPSVPTGAFLEPAPTIFSITDFRRDAAGIIGGAVASGAPVFVTQHSSVTAVVLSRHRYEHLLHRLAFMESRTAALSAPGEQGAEGAQGADPLPAAKAATRGATVLVETQFGLVDPDTADFLRVEGY